MTLVLILISLIVVLFPFFIGQRFGTVRLVSPLHLLSYFTFFGVFLKTIYMRMFDGRMFFENYAIDDPGVLAGYLFITGFVLSICVGYTISVRKVWRVDTRHNAADIVRQVRNPGGLVVLAFVIAALVVGNMLAVRGLGGIGSAFSLATIDALNSSKILRIDGVDGFGASGAALKTLLFVPTLTLAVFLARFVLWRRKRDLFVLIIVSALQVFLTVVQGGRFGLVSIVALFVIVPLILGQKFSKGTLVKAAAGFFAVMFLFVMMTSFRASRDVTENVRFDVWPAVEQILASTYFLDINVPILVIEMSDPEDRFWGMSYTYWSYAWVPRQFWPEKPAVTLGPYVKQEVLGIGGSLGGINPTGPGEAFLNFGWFGMLLGGFVGFLFRRIEEFTLSTKGLLRRGGLWAYPIVGFPLIVGVIQSSFSAALVSSAVVYVLLTILLSILSIRLKSSIKYKPI